MITEQDVADVLALEQGDVVLGTEDKECSETDLEILLDREACMSLNADSEAVKKAVARAAGKAQVAEDAVAGSAAAGFELIDEEAQEQA